MKICQLPTLAALLTSGLLLGSCASKDVAPASQTLYERLGKTDGVTKIVDGLLVNVAAETALSSSVLLRSHKPLLDAVNGVNGAAPTDPARLQRLRTNFINQLGEATGGPLTYTGKSMLAAHAGMNITTNEYAVWFSQWENTLSANKVVGQDRSDLNAIINRMQSDVVGH
ncbi:MAG: group I truncated hemoglobin [Janthinobacterium lividum]